MAYYSYEAMKLRRPIGCFTEKEVGNYFEYSLNADEVFAEYPHIVWVGGPGQGYRYANVKKTVAYIVVDEDEHGAPVEEKWSLKKNDKYFY